MAMIRVVHTSLTIAFCASIYHCFYICLGVATTVATTYADAVRGISGKHTCIVINLLITCEI